MKYPVMLFALALFTLSQTTSAAEKTPGSPPDGADFAKHKAEVIKKYEAKLNCMKAATNQEGMKACHEQAKKDQMKSNMERLEQQQQKLDARKQKLQERMGK